MLRGANPGSIENRLIRWDEVVEPRGIEPLTSTVRTSRSPI